MADPNSTPGQTRSWVLVVPPLFILIVFGVFVASQGFPHSKELETAAKELVAAKAAAVSPAEVAQVQALREEMKNKLTAATNKMKDRQIEARVFVGVRASAVDRLDVMNAMQDCFEDSNLTVTIEKAHEGSDQIALISSLRTAGGKLATTIDKTTRAMTKAPPINPAQMTPEALQAAQNPQAQQGVAREVTIPPLRELVVHGTYVNMLEALHNISRDCGETTVISLSLERPESNGGRAPSTTRTWRLLVNVQPAPDGTPKFDPEKLVTDHSR